MMRRRYQRRSLSTAAIWGTALIAITGLLAWQFGWWPEKAGGPPAVAHSHPLEEAAGGEPEPMPYEPVDVDPIVFQQQSEPELIQEPFDRPENTPSLYERSPYASANTTENPLGAMPAAAVQEPAALPPVDPAAHELLPHNGPAPERYSRAQAQPAGSSAILPVAHDVPASEETPAPAAEQPQAATETIAVPATGSDLDQIDRQIAAGEYLEAHKALSKIYWNQPERRPDLQERIDRTAEIIYFSPQPHFMPAYVIEPGDLLSKVATKYSVPWQYLARLNRVDPQRVQAGQRLKVIKGPFSAMVDLDRFELIVHAHGYYVRRFPIGIGKDHSTPTGKFTVRNKESNPTYYGTDEQTGRRFIVERDDPQNPLGERWIDLGDSYGIHGTIEPESIGKAESRGCVRMHNQDVELVYDLLSVGSEVVIRQ